MALSVAPGGRRARGSRRDDVVAVASWSHGAVHVWGWDGVQSAAPMWLYRRNGAPGWPDAPASAGYQSSLDITTPSGERLRPMSIRLDDLSGVVWLTGLDSTASEPLGWFHAVVELANAVVDRGAVLPTVDGDISGRDRDFDDTLRPGDVRWTAVRGGDIGAALDEQLAALAAAVPPICLPAIRASDETALRRTVGEVFDDFVDWVARARLDSDGWKPTVPRDRKPDTAAAKLLFTSLTGHDRRLPSTTSANTDALGRAERWLHRLGRRAERRPVVIGRLRLVVPTDRADPWLVELELVDADDRGRWCSASDVWAETPLAVELAGGDEHLYHLGEDVVALAATAAGAADVLADLAAATQPVAVELDVDEGHVEDFLDQAPAELERRGIELIGPEHLVRSSIAVRGSARPAQPSDRKAGLDRETLVNWNFNAVDTDGQATAISEAELARAEEFGASLLHIGNRWVRIDPAAIRKARERQIAYAEALAALEATTDSGDHPDGAAALEMLRIAADVAAAGDLLGIDGADPEFDDDLGDDPDGEELSAAWSGLLLGGLPDTTLREEHEPAAFRGELRPYQRRGLSWLRFLARLGLGGCLADDMGLGKTATTLAHLVDRPGPHLVVCPLSVVHNWETEARRFTPTLPVTVFHGGDRHDSVDDTAPSGLVVTTYGLLARDLEKLAAIDWSTVVLDEAQFVKNASTKAARAARKLRARQRVALTGTPVENRLAELWAILDWTNPGMLGSRERFRHRYSKPIERGDDEQLAADAAASLKALTQSFVLRRSKADRQLVPELPDKIEQVAYAGLTREQATLYQKVVDQLVEDANAAEGMKRRSVVLAALTKLKQICNHPAHALGDGSRIDGRSGKLARFDELVDELVDVDARALVFTQFVAMGSLLQQHLASRYGWAAPFLNGSMPKARRDKVVAEFQAGGGPPLLLVSLKAGGTGLNLTAASQVIHYDRWWNPAVENQATDRAWRIGQGETVLVHKLVCEGTVEERIAAIIDDKQRLADLVVGHGETWLSELSTADLHELVRLDTGDER